MQLHLRSVSGEAGAKSQFTTKRVKHEPWLSFYLRQLEQNKTQHCGNPVSHYVQYYLHLIYTESSFLNRKRAAAGVVQVSSGPDWIPLLIKT